MTEPIYSDDPSEEARMLMIRDQPADRTRLIAASRVPLGRQQPRFHDDELQWIHEDFRFNHMLPTLNPQEYSVLIESLVAECRFHRMQKACFEAAIKDLESQVKQ